MLIKIGREKFAGPESRLKLNRSRGVLRLFCGWFFESEAAESQKSDSCFSSDGFFYDGSVSAIARFKRDAILLGLCLLGFRHGLLGTLCHGDDHRAKFRAKFDDPAHTFFSIFTGSTRNFKLGGIDRCDRGFDCVDFSGWLERIVSSGSRFCGKLEPNGVSDEYRDFLIRLKDRSTWQLRNRHSVPSEPCRRKTPYKEELEHSTQNAVSRSFLFQLETRLNPSEKLRNEETSFYPKIQKIF